jgi:hypothetical protein
VPRSQGAADGQQNVTALLEPGSVMPGTVSHLLVSAAGILLAKALDKTVDAFLEHQGPAADVDCLQFASGNQLVELGPADTKHPHREIDAYADRRTMV